MQSLSQRDKRVVATNCKRVQCPSGAVLNATINTHYYYYITQSTLYDYPNAASINTLINASQVYLAFSCSIFSCRPGREPGV